MKSWPVFSSSVSQHLCRLRASARQSRLSVSLSGTGSSKFWYQPSVIPRPNNVLRYLPPPPHPHPPTHTPYPPIREVMLLPLFKTTWSAKWWSCWDARSSSVSVSLHASATENMSSKRCCTPLSSVTFCWCFDGFLSVSRVSLFEADEGEKKHTVCFLAPFRSRIKVEREKSCSKAELSKQKCSGLVYCSQHLYFGTWVGGCWQWKFV